MRTRALSQNAGTATRCGPRQQQLIPAKTRLPDVQVRQLDGRYYLRADDFQGASSKQSGDVEGCSSFALVDVEFSIGFREERVTRSPRT
jgi:hypothetical protein